MCVARSKAIQNFILFFFFLIIILQAPDTYYIHKKAYVTFIELIRIYIFF